MYACEAVVDLCDGYVCEAQRKASIGRYAPDALVSAERDVQKRTQEGSWGLMYLMLSEAVG